MADLTPLLTSVSPAARARITRAMRDADRLVRTAPDAPAKLESSSSTIVPRLPSANADRAAADWVLTVFEVVVSLEADRFARAAWLDQLIDWSYGRHHSGAIPLETFARSVYQMVTTRAWWRDEVRTPSPKMPADTPAQPLRGRKRVKVKFGTQLHRLRVEARLTVEELAELADVDRTTVLPHEQNTQTPRPKTVKKYEAALARALNRQVKFDL